MADGKDSGEGAAEPLGDDSSGAVGVVAVSAGCPKTLSWLRGVVTDDMAKEDTSLGTKDRTDSLVCTLASPEACGVTGGSEASSRSAARGGVEATVTGAVCGGRAGRVALVAAGASTTPAGGWLELLLACTERGATAAAAAARPRAATGRPCLARRAALVVRLRQPGTTAVM